MFECVETVDKIYKVGAPSKNTQLAESNRASSGRKQKWGGADLTSNTEKLCAGKRKKSDTGHPSDAPTGAENTCMLHIPGHSSKEWKVLKDYSENHAAQQPFKGK